MYILAERIHSGARWPAPYVGLPQGPRRARRGDLPITSGPPGRPRTHRRDRAKDQLSAARNAMAAVGPGRM